MNRIRIATKYFLGNSFYNSIDGIKSKKLMIFFYLLMVFIVSTPLCIMVGELYSGFEAIGQTGYIVSLILLTGSMIGTLLGIYNVLDSFFFSNDVETILPLPFKPSEIMISKFLTTMIDMYMYMSIMILPLILFGIVSSQGIVYYILLIPVFLITPIVPLILCILLTMILMRFTNIFKHKDMFKMLSGIIGIIFIIAINSFNFNSADNTEILKLIQEKNGFMNLINGVFFTNIFSAKALVYNNTLDGLLNLGILTGIAIIATVILYVLGEKIYYKSILGASETFSKRENILENNKSVVNERSKLMTLVTRDIKNIFREPSNFINCVVMILYMPAFIFIFFIKGNITDAINQEELGMIIVSATFLFSTLTISGGSVSTTALSREGKDIFISKYIPVNYKTQIHSKIISSILINSISILLGIVVLIYLKASPLVFLMSLIIQVLVTCAISITGVYLDYSSPRLKWVEAKSLYNKNFKPFIMIILSLVIGVIIIYISSKFNSLIFPFLFSVMISIIIILLLYRILMKIGYKAYMRD